MDKLLTKAATLGETFVGFLNHHINDLTAVGTALQGVLAAVPVNAETRASINAAIAVVETSAKNVKSSLVALDALKVAPAPSRDEALEDMIAAYMAEHHPVAASAPQQDAGAATTAVKGAIMQDSDRSGAQQMSDTVKVATASVQDGTNKSEDAPAPNA